MPSCEVQTTPGDSSRLLYEIAGDADAPANSRLSAIKEILDRAVGKGAMLDGAEHETAPVENRVPDRRRTIEYEITPPAGGIRNSQARLKRCSAVQQAAAKATGSCSTRCVLP